MNDIHALSGAYAIDALDDVERARFERHLAACADCRAEVDGLREAAAQLAETTTAAPPASLRARVLDDIDGVRPLPPVVAGDSPGPPGRRRVVALVAAAAALIAIGGVGATIWHPWSDESSESPPVSDIERVIAAPDAEIWTDRLDNGATITVIRSASLNRAVVQTDGMEPAGADRVYQLWLQHGNEFVSAGLMLDTDIPVLLEGDPGSAVGFGITREPAGGSDRPTRPPVSLIELERA